MKTFNKVCLGIAILISFLIVILGLVAPAFDSLRHFYVLVGADLFFFELALFPLP